MNTSVLVGGTNRTSEDCQEFLRDGYELINRLVKAHDLIAEYLHPTRDVTCSVMPGISEQDIHAAYLNEGMCEVVGMRVDSLLGMLMSGKFGDGAPLLKMKRALNYVVGLEASFGFMTNLVPEKDELLEIWHNIEFALGNWLYGFAYTIDLEFILQCDAKQEDYRLHQEVANWVAKTPSGRSVFSELSVLRVKFVPIVEAFREYPDEWSAFINKAVPKEFHDDVIMYAEHVYLCDIIAILEGQVEASEEYIQLLRDRRDNEMSAENQNPDILAKFMQKIPAKYAYILITYANEVTLDMMLEVIDGEKEINPEFIANLESKRKGSAVDVTSAFADLG